jgi:asparagine synthase (glutamine-hydrolysing)
MCGLIAIYDSRHCFGLPSIEAIRNSLSHRGPDGFSYFQTPHLFMGHSHLRVESSKTDRQPIRSVDGSVTVIVNGELYPHLSLKQELQSKGYYFQTESDSELALALYQYYGDNFIKHLRGEFACILWDAKRQLLLAVRDRFGIKPLHYAELNERWYLGSEAKALIAAGYPAQWNMHGLLQSFSHQYLKPGYSLFSGVKQLLPGFCLKIKRGKARVEPYYSLAFNDLDVESEPFDVAVDKVRSMLMESIEIRIPSREKCAFSLSGGLDSSTVVSVAARFLDYPPDCYSVSFDHKDYDEYSLVDGLTLEKPIHLHRVNVTSDDVIQYMEEATFFSEGLAYNGQSVAKYLLNRAIANDGYRVVMSGEGADEAFMGYAHLHHDYLCHQQLSAGETTDSKAVRTLLDKNKLQAGLMLGATAGSNPSMGHGYVPSFLRAKFKFCSEFSNLFSSVFFSCDEQIEEQDSLISLMDENLTEVLRSNKLWIQVVLANYILKTLGDGMEMASSVEGRLPFLDHRLFDYAARLPVQHKLSSQEAKVILRSVVTGLVPESVRKRRKHPFIAPPIASTLSDSGFDLIMDRFKSESFRDNPIFSQKAVLAWVKRWRKQKDSRSSELDPPLMMLLSFSALQARFGMGEAR